MSSAQLRPARTLATGLHGHPIATNSSRATAAEFIGTFILVFAIAGTAVAAVLNAPVAGPAYNSIAVPLAGGFGLAVAVAALGHVSGAHLNPAVTIALATLGRFPWREVPLYLVAQLAGATAAALVVWAIDGGRARSIAGLGATVPAPNVSGGRVLLVEAFVAFILVLVVIAVATDDRVPRGAAAVPIGFALAVAIFISGPVTGAGVNPARALGPMLVADRLQDWWAYLVGPLVGGVAAALLYDRILHPGSRPS